MKWPWRRHQPNGEAEQAGRDAQEQLRTANGRTSEVEAKARAARELARRTDRFAREIERSWRVKRGPV